MTPSPRVGEMLVGKGLIQVNGGTVTATVHKTQAGYEYARLPGGLLLLPSAYRHLEVYEINERADLLRIDAFLETRRR